MNTQTEEVKEEPDPLEVNDGYTNTNKIFTFPLSWDVDKCLAYCEDRNYNAFVIGFTDEGACRFTCAYSWRLSYLHQFGEYPTD